MPRGKPRYNYMQCKSESEVKWLFFGTEEGNHAWTEMDESVWRWVAKWLAEAAANADELPKPKQCAMYEKEFEFKWQELKMPKKT